MYKDNIKLNDDIEVISGEKPVEFIGDTRARKLRFASGKEISADGFFIIRDSSKPHRLIPSIASDNNHIIIDQNCRTNIRGLYAAGDLAGKPYQINKAVGQGQIAGLDAAKYVDLIKSGEFKKENW